MITSAPVVALAIHPEMLTRTQLGSLPNVGSSDHALLSSLFFKKKKNVLWLEGSGL